VLPQDGQGFIHLVAQVRAVVIAVQLDVADAGFRQAGGGIRQGSMPKPVAPGEIEAGGELFGVVVL